MKERVITSEELEDDGVVDNTIRPEVLDEYIGQSEVKENIRVFIKSALMKNGRGIRLEQMCKAESDIAVAAASVLARATFVQRMQVMENSYGIKFPKGCSGLVKIAAGEFIAKYGKDRLKEVCKTHFRTFKEV